MSRKKNQPIIEKRLGIPGDYQYKALRSANFLQSNWYLNKLLVIETLCDFKSTTRVLDLGIGSGNFELKYASKVRGIVGIDYNDEALNFVKKNLNFYKLNNVKLICEDIRNLNKLKKLSKFNLIIISDVIEHITKNEAKTVIKSLKKFIKPDGYICVITPNYNSAWRIIEVILDKFTPMPKLKGEQHLAKYDTNSISKIFEEGGFITKKLTTFNFISWLMPTKTLSVSLLKLELHLLKQGGNLLVGIFNKNHEID